MVRCGGQWGERGSGALGSGVQFLGERGRRPRGAPASTSLGALLLAAGCLSAVSACSSNDTYYVTNIVQGGSDAGVSETPHGSAGADGAGEVLGAGGSAPVASEGNERPPLGGPGGVRPVGSDVDAGVVLSPGAPKADVAASEFEIDVFGAIGNHYWFEASSEQVDQMNAPYGGGGGVYYGDIYSPTGSGNVTFVDHLLVTSAGDSPHTADFGKVQVKLVGQSTGRPWTETSLPNFKIDADEFVDGNRIGGVKHLRLNNAVVGSIYREKLVYDIYRALAYPAPRSNYGWASGSVWGPGVDVPYIVVESYKPQFCKLREAELGGGCVNMWEFYGDIGTGVLSAAENCQFSECDSTRAEEFEDLIAATPQGEGFKDALADWLDWDAFHRFQCLSWILETPDDAIHALNNVLVAERADGKFQLLPYSIDISLNPDWGYYSQLAGSSTLAMGCQSDSQCWADTVATCEVLIDEFAAIDPLAMLDAINDQLDAHGMLRSGDADRYRTLRQHIEQRIADLPAELELNRYAPSVGYCPLGMEQCGYDCVYPGECQICEQPLPPEEEPTQGEVGAAPSENPDAGAPAVDEPPVEQPPVDEPPAPCIPVIPLYDVVVP